MNSKWRIPITGAMWFKPFIYNEYQAQFPVHTSIHKFSFDEAEAWKDREESVQLERLVLSKTIIGQMIGRTSEK